MRGSPTLVIPDLIRDPAFVCEEASWAPNQVQGDVSHEITQC